MNIEKALATPGWMEEGELRYLAELASKANRIVEIGSWRGRSARCLADNTLGKVWCVDTWDDAGVGIDGWWNSTESPAKHLSPGWLWREFDFNLRDHLETGKIQPMRMPSVEAASKVEGPFDLIFIDASHDYDSVKQDILAWRPLLGARGVLAGHDYGHPLYPGVKQAVDELVGPCHLCGTIWSTEEL